MLNSLIEYGDGYCDEGCKVYYSVLETDRHGLTPGSDGFDCCHLSSMQLISRSGDLVRHVVSVTPALGTGSSHPLIEFPSFSMVNPWKYWVDMVYLAA